ncbi:hypothetical protein BH23GEM3_BH23GEM3_18840 [soil metagenome]|nr:hypothetical protein [Gemmatimonadota bacterium]
MKRGKQPEPDRFRHWKVTLFFLAAGAWFAGVITAQPLITGTAIVLLLVAVGLRLFSGTEQSSETESEDGEV